MGAAPGFQARLVVVPTNLVDNCRASLHGFGCPNPSRQEAPMQHGRPRLNLFARQLLVERVHAGWTPAAAAEASGVSRATTYKWLRRFRQEGGAGLLDRSSRPHRSPTRISVVQEAALLALRRQRKLGPHRLAPLTGCPRSPCYAVLRRHRLPRLHLAGPPARAPGAAPARG